MGLRAVAEVVGKESVKAFPEVEEMIFLVQAFLGLQDTLRIHHLEPLDANREVGHLEEVHNS